MSRIWNSWKLNVDETCFATTAIAMLPIKTVQRIYFGDAHTTWNSVAVHPLWLREIWPWFGMRARRTHINPIKRTWNEPTYLFMNFDWIFRFTPIFQTKIKLCHFNKIKTYFYYLLSVTLSNGFFIFIVSNISAFCKSSVSNPV